MGRFHINSCTIIIVEETITNNILLDSLYQLKCKINMDVYISSDYFLQEELVKFNRGGSPIFYKGNIFDTPYFKKKIDTYDHIIIIPLKDYIIHSHLPQFISNIYNYQNLKKIPYKISLNVLEYLKENNKIKFIDNKIEENIIILNNHDSLIKYFDKNIEIETIKIESTNHWDINHGLIKINNNHPEFNYSNIIHAYYRKFIYNVEYIDIKPEYMIDNINNNKPYTYIRIGDGEQHCIQSQYTNNFNSHNKNGCNFSTDGLAESILEILNDNDLINKDNIYLAWNPATIRNRYDCYKVINEKKPKSDMIFIAENTTLILKLLDDPNFLKNFFNSINKSSRIIYTGPEYLNNEKNPIKYHDFITIPTSNCFDESYNIFRKIEDQLIGNNNLVFFSGGLGIKSTIYKLYKKYGNNHTFYDIGSALDPFVDKWSRSVYRKNMDKIKKNLEQIIEM